MSCSISCQQMKEIGVLLLKYYYVTDIINKSAFDSMHLKNQIK